MLVFPAVLLLLAEHLNSDIASVLGFSFWMYLLFGCTALLWGMAADYWGAGILMVVYFVGPELAGWRQLCGFMTLRSLRFAWVL